ncbi:AAA family ATPase [Candidatus Uhrbacteria bacterium]|nr:AAA family ATPase [Candidatus Uhrbacteria bacterium]
MFLQKLEIQGFKSFAPKTTFLFPAGTAETKGVTAVVGPNGSGKSNVSDAIRWVLGEQSMRLLRSKKGEDVIFFGSDKKAQLGFCEVSLFFNNEDRTFPLDFSEVVITRRLYRSGESEYLINRAKARLSDVALLVAQARIGQKSYSVIGQGMIDSIITTPPSERKEFFDEAAGVKQYQIKKDAALSKLKSSQENLSQAQSIVAELEPKMKFFQRQLKRLEEREEVEGKLLILQKQYYNALWNDLENSREQASSRRSALQSQIDYARSEYAHIQSAFSKLEMSNSTATPREYLELQKKYAELQRKKNEALAESSLLEGRLHSELEKKGEAQLAWTLKQKTDTRHRLDAAQRALEQINHDIVVLKESEKGLLLENEELERVLTSKEEEAIREQDTRGINLEGVIQELRDLRLHAHEEHTVLDQLRNFISHAWKRVETLIARIEKTLSSSDNKGKTELQELATTKKALEQKLQHIRLEYGIKESQMQLHQNEFSRLQHEVDRLEKDITYFSSAADNKHKKSDLLKEKKELDTNITELEAVIQRTSGELQEWHAKEKERTSELLAQQKEMARKQKEIEQLQSVHTQIELEIAKLEAHIEELLSKIFEELHIEESQCIEIKNETESLYSILGFQKVVETFNRVEVKETIDRLKRKLEQIGTIDQEIVSEHEATKERYDFLTAQITDLTAAIASLKSAIAELDEHIRVKFDAALANINVKFNAFFQQLFHGGSARLLVYKKERSENPEDEEDGDTKQEHEDEIAGIEIEATPPGKKLKSIAVLSGGEKAMTAIALICAILANNASPFVVLDEVDAALDESNAHRYAEILLGLAARTQFVVITHNRVTIQTANVLYGITMGDDGISHALSLDPALTLSKTVS